MAHLQSGDSFSAPTPRKRRWWRWLKGIALCAIALVLIAVLAGILYEWLASRADARRFPQRGRSVDVGGFRLNIDCTGTASPGVPTVILESGGGVPGFGWKLVQPEVAKLTRVCSYDHAGYGWSDPPTEVQRSSLQIARELHALLRNASVSPPYVLIGHSLGGFNIRVYNHQYPDEVAGAVFVDSSHEDQLERIPPELKKIADPGPDAMRWRMRLIRLALYTGVMRFMQRRARASQTLPQEFMEELEYLQRKRAFLEAIFGEINAFRQSTEQVRDSGNFGDKPVIVLTAGKVQSVPGIPQETVEHFQQVVWIQDLQPRLAALSTQGKQIVVPNSTHMIPFEAPQVIVDAVGQVVAAASRHQ